jgi:hypothetical protein
MRGSRQPDNASTKNSYHLSIASSGSVGRGFILTLLDARQFDAVGESHAGKLPLRLMYFYRLKGGL